MFLLMVALVIMTFASTSAVIYLVFDRALQRGTRGCDGTFFCHQCNYVVGYRRSGYEMTIGRFVEKSDEPSLPDNVIPLRRYSDSEDENYF